MKIQTMPIEVIQGVKILLGLLAIFILTKYGTRLILKMLKRHPKLQDYQPIVKNILRILFFSIGILIILDSVGISITPIMASLGIGGLAIGLALKETLSNYFSGLYLLVDRSIRVGDFIQLTSGEQGYVHDINWRSTRVRMLANQMITIPNSVLSSGAVLNFDFPSSEVAVLVELGVHYDSDLSQVERVTVEVAKTLQQTVSGAVKEHEPFIRFHTFADFSINFTVILRASHFVNSYLLKHEFIKRLHERYKQEKIVIPYPIRTMEFPVERRG